MEQVALEKALIEKLKKVIDPETGADVIRMKLIQNLEIDEKGKVAYTFRPSSPLCPMAVPLAMMIIDAIGEVEGVTGQSVNVVDYVEADKLNETLRSVLGD